MPGSLKLLDKNARRMSERQFRTLCDNVRRDGCLTSTPLVVNVEGKLVVISGNHRVKAAIAVGLKSISVMEITTPLSEARRVAIQIAQNAIAGEDDQNILAELYDALDVVEKRYSGLTDADLGALMDPQLEKLRIGMPKYEEVVLAFLPEDKVEFLAEFERLTKRSKAAKIVYARFSDYPAFFERMVQTKIAEKVGNDAVTIAIMIRLAHERLDQIVGGAEVGEEIKTSATTAETEAASVQ